MDEPTWETVTAYRVPPSNSRINLLGNQDKSQPLDSLCHWGNNSSPIVHYPVDSREVPIRAIRSLQMPARSNAIDRLIRLKAANKANAYLNNSLDGLYSRKRLGHFERTKSRNAILRIPFSYRTFNNPVSASAPVSAKCNRGRRDRRRIRDRNSRIHRRSASCACAGATSSHRRTMCST